MGDDPTRFDGNQDAATGGDGDGGRSLAVDRTDLALSLSAGVAALAGSYALAGFTTGFVVAPVESTLSRLMPGAVVTAAILFLGGLGQRLNLFVAALLTVAMFAAVVYATRRITREAGGRAVPVVLPAAGAFGLAALLTATVVPALGAGAAVGVALAVGDLAAALFGDHATGAADESAPRRRILGAIAGTLGVGVVGYLLGSRLTPGDDPGPGDGSPTGPVTLQGVDRDAIRELIDEGDRKDLRVAGMDGLVSRSFYEVDVSAVNPTVRTGDYSLRVTGDVDREVSYDYADLRGMAATSRFETLRCVGEELNGHKMDTALWTGVPARDLLEEANPRGEYVVLRAADGYWEEFPIDAMRDGLIAYGMNGAPLPTRHGYPVRALVPGHWGEINVKWLTEIEISDEPVTGYWEKRGWHGTGPVKTVAKIHAVNRGDGRIEVGGHAYAGTRGVQTVEVSVDGGQTWTEAQLSEPLPGIDVWRQWVHRYEDPGESHEVIARAVDGTGTVQPEKRESPYPSGPGGWVSTRIG